MLERQLGDSGNKNVTEAMASLNYTEAVRGE